ncbi:MAG: response regulator YycF [Anaerolineae bacterium]
MNRRVHILIIDDDPVFASGLEAVLHDAGYTSEWASSGQEGLRAAYERRPDLVLLDFALPDIDGLAVLQQIRKELDIPVIIISGQSSKETRNRLLELGADDYIAKPFNKQVLMARITARLRRASAEPSEITRLRLGSLSLDPLHQRAKYGTLELPLSPTEFTLLFTLALHADEIVTPERLIEAVWPSGEGNAAVLRVTISRLRQKLTAVAGETHLIQTIPRQGYRLHVP